MSLMHRLTQIGFTEYEARIYLALLQDNPATGYQLSKRSGVPRSMAYEALGRLDTRGAVLQTSDGKSTRYRPLPPQMLLARERAEHNKRIDALVQGLDELYQASDGDQIWSISGREAVLAYAAQQIQSAEVELMLVLDDLALNELDGQIGAAHARGIRLRTLLTGEGNLEYGEIAHHPPLESELQELTDSLVVVVDAREVLISGGGPRFSATITNNRNVVLIARQFVWMELFAQRAAAILGPEVVGKLIQAGPLRESAGHKIAGKVG
jgi:sugar-specific transcriptional regulator TrmB